MEVGAARAGPDDLATLVDLAEAAITELAPARGGYIWSRLGARRPPFERGFEAELADPDRLLAVGTIDHTVVGYAAAEQVLLHDGHHLGRLTDIFVLPGARGVGVGEEMMELAIEWCRRFDAVGIDSMALPGDRATKNFFETFGLVARSLTVHRRLDQ